jgi:hypothetical protein
MTGKTIEIIEQEPKVLLARKVHLDQQEHQVPKEFKVNKVQQVQQEVRQVHLVLQDVKEFQVLKVKED